MEVDLDVEGRSNQGFNAQAAVNEQQIVLAAEITNNSTDTPRPR